MLQSGLREPSGAKRQTRAERVKALLAQAIISREFPPGITLDEAALATRFGVSRTPVREAIRDLAAMGLVQVRPHRGAIVTRPDARELADMFAVMAELEALCAGRAAVAMDRAERAQLEAIHAQLRAMVSKNDIAGYRAINDRFHSSIYDGCNNGYLSEITRATRRRLSPFRQAQFVSAGRLAQSYIEHDEIVSAIMRGDAGKAASVMRAHIMAVEYAFEQMEFAPR